MARSSSSRSARPRYDLLDKALDTLHKARGRALGIVLNKAPLRGVDASPYSYEYRREYSKAPKVPEETVAPAGVDRDVTGSVDDLVTEPPARPARRGRRG